MVSLFHGGQVVALNVSLRKPNMRFMPPPLRTFSRRHQTWFHCTKTWSVFLHGGHFVALTVSPLGTILPHQFNRRAHKQKWESLAQCMKLILSFNKLCLVALPIGDMPLSKCISFPLFLHFLQVDEKFCSQGYLPKE